VVLRGQKDLDPLHLPTVHAADLMPRSADRPDRPAIEMIVGGRGDQTLSRLPVSAAPGPDAAASNVQPMIVSRAAR
jgi:hypothetical protein